MSDKIVTPVNDNNIFTPLGLLRQLLGAMEMREMTGQRPANYDEVMGVAKDYYPTDVMQSQAVNGMFEALRMQDARETEEFHITQEVMMPIWSKAKSEGIKAIQALHFRPAANRKASQGLKTRANALASAVQPFGASLVHTQALTAMSRMYGYDSYHALRHAMSRPQPAFCPHCGAAGTLKPSTHANDAAVISYACQSCSGTFAAPRQSPDVQGPNS